MRADVILRILIRRGFPELAGKRFRIQSDEYDDWMWYDLCGDAFVIGADNSFRTAPRRVLEGGLAHELAHIVRDRRFGPFQRSLAYARYGLLPSFRVRDEQDTDREAIRRGYGRQLLALMLWARARGYTSGREHGLLLDQVTRLVKAAGG